MSWHHPDCADGDHPRDLPCTVPERRWTPADRELVVGVLWTRACQGGNAGVRMDPQPARDAPMHYWADAAALLDALAAAGKLAGPDHDARVRAEERARVAEGIAQAIEIGRGDRCPTCHGKPASTKWRGLRKTGRCGAGHEWEMPVRDWPDAAAIARTHAAPEEEQHGV